MHNTLSHFAKKTIVIKCGGAAMAGSKTATEAMAQSIAVLHQAGIKIILVHGGGPEISAFCTKLNIPIQFLNGQRVTNAATLEAVQMILLGKTNPALVLALHQAEVPAVGLSGQGFIQVEKENRESKDLGFVGKITSVDPVLVELLGVKHFVPVVAPLGCDVVGQTYNINADKVAAELAIAVNACVLIFLSDVDGLYKDFKDPNTLLSTLSQETLRHWLEGDGPIVGGMIPKCSAALNALSNGVQTVYFLNGTVEKTLENALSGMSLGTKVER